MTNLWGGFKKSLDLLTACQRPGCLQHMLLLTDGDPNINPPRGIMPMMRKCGKLPCTVSTFGFGYELDSELLAEMAAVGSGSYSFIPDAGFVGTVFVNTLANLRVTIARDLALTIKSPDGCTIDSIIGYPTPNDSEEARVDLGSVQLGQTREVVLYVFVQSGDLSFLETSLSFTTGAGVQKYFAKAPVNLGSAERWNEHWCRLMFAQEVRRATKALKLTNLQKAEGKVLSLDRAQTIIEEVGEQIYGRQGASEVIEALVEDLRGQVCEAFSRADWYQKWGIHFLQSLVCAHVNQQCNNFKDPGVQQYGGELFKELRDEAGAAFEQIPPPKAASTTNGQSSYQIQDMSQLYDRYAGCVNGDCVVRMADGSDKRLADIKKGDTVKGDTGVADVMCVVRTKAPNTEFLLSQLPGTKLRITPYHPVLIDNQWHFPADLAIAAVRPCEAVYTLVLGNNACTFVAEGISCASLGHCISHGIARHPYYGSQRVLSDLAQFPGFQEGLVDLLLESTIRDSTGLACGLIWPGREQAMIAF